LPDDENPGLLEVKTTVPPHVHPQVLVSVLHAQAEGGVGQPFHNQTCPYLGRYFFLVLLVDQKFAENKSSPARKK
jgi:hypothetical protein